MAKFNAINEAVFTALKVSEISKVPTLFMSNPGLGKSTSVSIFAAVKGYELEVLRGSTTSESEVLGYDVAANEADSNTTKHLRPSWYSRILDTSAKGGKTLLFLDEITTANSYVQAALLNLIFDRTVGPESLPENTLIVSAGNYAQNLATGMNLLPPLMNRFMIVNLEATSSDLEGFLCKYKGSLAGNKLNLYTELSKLMVAIDKQELTINDDMLDKIGEYFETSVRKTAQSLSSGGTKEIDFNIKDLQGIYEDATGDSKLYGFATYRTLNYLRDIAIASYKCFGKAGITSDNFANMAEGLVGIAQGKNGPNGTIKINNISNHFLQSLRTVTNDIAKLNNNKLSEYDKYFEKLIKDKSIDSGKVEYINALINKITELRSDKGLEGIDRPISDVLIKGLCTGLSKSMVKITSAVGISPDEDSDIPPCDQTTVEDVVNGVIIYNAVRQCLDSIQAMVNDLNLAYDDATKNLLMKEQKTLTKSKFFYKFVKDSYKATGRMADFAMIPEIK